MELTIVIVNYNVSHFLEQCLIAVHNALRNMDGEIIVVDNNSVDGSLEMLKTRFPEVHLIANKENLGFAKANNQAMKIALGEFILLLNPDTVVEDGTFQKTIRFMNSHPDAGGLGVKMVDGSGKFLPESKRGLPTPESAFYKIFGLSSLFPHSKRFSKYNLGYLNENEVNEVDVLAGAFMLLRKSVLNQIGLLDESFFMYGEDIDLSYRITKAGYKNYYFPETRIIHYKGESTRKSSINYVLVFYKAMLIFARKHFTGKNAWLLSLLINVSIYFRAFIALLSRFFEKIVLPLLDALILWGGIWLVKEIWEREFIYPNGGSYPDTFVYFVMPVYVLVWLVAIFFSGGYKRPVKIRKPVIGILSGTVAILVLYALLPESLRFSRAQILIDTIWGVFALSFLRYLLHIIGIPGFKIGSQLNKRFLIIGDRAETERVASILEEFYLNPGFIGKIIADENTPKLNGFIGNILQVKDIITIYHIDEIIFCSKNLSHQTIIDKMAEWKSEKVDYKIAPEDSLSIIGSSSINTQGELYAVEINTINKRSNRLNKRVFDFMVSLIFIPLYPILVFFVQSPIGFLRNIFSVLTGAKSWVGLTPTLPQPFQLNIIKPGVLSSLDGMKNRITNKETIKKLNLLYVRDYSLLKDINIILFALRKLGKR